MNKIELDSYDHIIVAFSGGKDSTACFLHLLDLGVDKSKIELWHHLVDGQEGSTFMDWPVTKDYCREFGKAFDVPVYFSWKEGGFEREMLRDHQATAPSHFEYLEDNAIECGIAGGHGPEGTRLKFPQVSADLKVRWCSAYLKIDVATIAITNQDRFDGKKTLMITGERAQESTARSRYAVFELDRADRREGKKARHVDHWRPVHPWMEEQVWEIIQKYKVIPHPAYRLGWGRLSCMKCIFGSRNQWKSVYAIDRDGFMKIYDYEKQFGLTIDRNKSVLEKASEGSVYRILGDKTMKVVLWDALTDKYHGKIFADQWEIPAGAFGDLSGPT